MFLVESFPTTIGPTVAEKGPMRTQRRVNKLSHRTIAGSMCNTLAHANSFMLVENAKQHKKGFSDEIIYVSRNLFLPIIAVTTRLVVSLTGSAGRLVAATATSSLATAIISSLERMSTTTGGHSIR